MQRVFLQHFPDLEVEFNSTAPRRGAFELVVTNCDGVESVLWSGLKKGPPRRLKFPDPNALVDDLKKALA